MNYFTDVISNGIHVRSAVDIDNGYVQFGASSNLWDAPIPLPTGKQGYYISAAHFDGQDWCYCVGNPNPSQSYLVNRQTREVKFLPNAYGAWSVWLTNSGLVCYCPNNHSYNVNGIVTEAATGSQGFRDVNENGHVTLRDGNFFVFRKGYKLGIYRVSGIWEVGISEDNLIVAYNTITDKLYRVGQVQTPVGIKVTQLDNSIKCIVSISRPFDFKTYYIHSDAFTEIDTSIIIAEKYARKMMCCPYDQFSNYGDTSRFIGNCAFPWTGHFQAVPKDVGLMVGYDTYDPNYINRTLYYYIHSQGLTSVSTKEQINFFADKPVKPFILYYDSRDWPATLPTYLEQYRNRLFIGAQCYPKTSEDILKFEDEMIEMFNKIKAYKLPIWASLAFWNTIPIDRLPDYFSVYNNLIEEYNVIGIQPFSDMRPGGMNSNPFLYDYLEDFYAAIPARLSRYDGWYENDHSLTEKLKYEMPMFTTYEKDRLTKLVRENPD